MRTRVATVLHEMMVRAPSLYLLTADTGFHVFDDFPRLFPGRYFNAGLAESAMTGMAAGLALCGKRVVTYGIAPFVTLRCYEHIRVDLCYQRLAVTIIGVGAGLTYGAAGPTHHTLEDVAALAALPHMTVVCPGDPAEAEQALRAALALDGPCYLRLGKSGERVIHADGAPGFAIGAGIELHRGGQVTLIATGALLDNAEQAWRLLRARGVDAGLVSMHTVKPLDEALLLTLARRTQLLAVLEEHSTRGGLAAAVAQVLAAEGCPVPLHTSAIPDVYADRAGSQAWLRRQYGLAPEQIADALQRRLASGAAEPCA
jgi:transketolase